MSLGIMFFCCCCSSASRFDVLYWLRDNLLHTLVVVSAYLRCYCLPISLTKASFSPLTSGKSKGFLSRQLDIFSSSDISLTSWDGCTSKVLRPILPYSQFLKSSFFPSLTLTLNSSGLTWPHWAHLTGLRCCHVFVRLDICFNWQVSVDDRCLCQIKQLRLVELIPEGSTFAIKLGLCYSSFSWKSKPILESTATMCHRSFSFLSTIWSSFINTCIRHVFLSYLSMPCTRYVLNTIISPRALSQLVSIVKSYYSKTPRNDYSMTVGVLIRLGGREGCWSKFAPPRQHKKVWKVQASLHCSKHHIPARGL